MRKTLVGLVGVGLLGMFSSVGYGQDTPRPLIFNPKSHAEDYECAVGGAQFILDRTGEDISLTAVNPDNDAYIFYFDKKNDGTLDGFEIDLGDGKRTTSLDLEKGLFLSTEGKKRGVFVDPKRARNENNRYISFRHTVHYEYLKEIGKK